MLQRVCLRRYAEASPYTEERGYCTEKAWRSKSHHCAICGHSLQIRLKSILPSPDLLSCAVLHFTADGWHMGKYIHILAEVLIMHHTQNTTIKSIVPCPVSYRTTATETEYGEPRFKYYLQVWAFASDVQCPAVMRVSSRQSTGE